jgi:hypothetical protein
MTVATLSRSPEVLARKRGTCPFCPEPIVAGEDYIAKVDGKGWMHAICAAAYLRHREAFDEEHNHDHGAEGAELES